MLNKKTTRRQSVRRMFVNVPLSAVGPAEQRPVGGQSTARAEMRDHVRITGLGREVVPHDGESSRAKSRP